MNFKIAFSAAMALLFCVMLVCPVAAMTLYQKASPESHCGSEVPGEEQLPEMQCCCDRDAVSVPILHAPYEDPVLEMISDPQVEVRTVVIAEHFDHFPHQKAREQLARLSILRL